ncbi:MAG: CinA family protein [Acidobacteria bacterium]|nr:CinA family protein [Acidobacteriota bacterium]
MNDDVRIGLAEAIGTAVLVFGGAGTAILATGGFNEGLSVGILGVSPLTIDEYGVVSEEVAIEMARGAQTALGVDVAVSVTGSAGPDPLGKDVGTMVIAVATPDDVRARTSHLPGDRERIRAYTATAALHMVRLALDGVGWETS